MRFCCGAVEGIGTSGVHRESLCAFQLIASRSLYCYIAVIKCFSTTVDLMRLSNRNFKMPFVDVDYGRVYGSTWLVDMLHTARLQFLGFFAILVLVSIPHFTDYLDLQGYRRMTTDESVRLFEELLEAETRRDVIRRDVMRRVFADFDTRFVQWFLRVHSRFS